MGDRQRGGTRTGGPCIGDSYTFCPSAFSREKDGTLPGKEPVSRELTGRVVYIHPGRRYFTVEAVMYGHIIRESFHFQPKQ